MSSGVYVACTMVDGDGMWSALGNHQDHGSEEETKVGEGGLVMTHEDTSPASLLLCVWTRSHRSKTRGYGCERWYVTHDLKELMKGCRLKVCKR